VLMRSAACAALMSLVCACDCHLLGQHARACVQQSGQRTRCNSLLLLPRHVPQAPLVRRRVACMSVEGSEVDPPADEREDNSAFTAFTSEIAQSPLLRQYGAAKAKAALAKAKESLADNVAEEYDAGLDYGRKLRARFLSPRIDDQGLPFADALASAAHFLSRSGRSALPSPLASRFHRPRGSSRPHSRRRLTGAGSPTSCRRSRTAANSPSAGYSARSLPTHTSLRRTPARSERLSPEHGAPALLLLGCCSCRLSWRPRSGSARRVWTQPPW